VNIEETVIAVISRVSGIDSVDIHPTSKLSDLDMDSLDRIECVLTLEDAVRAELKEGDLWKLKTVQDVIDAVGRVVAVEPYISR
jgi:acyl carrier protein